MDPRRAPQSGLALLISRISLRTSRFTDGRPDLERHATTADILAVPLDHSRWPNQYHRVQITRP
jgi:hypothetical protein